MRTDAFIEEDNKYNSDKDDKLKSMCFNLQQNLLAHTDFSKKNRRCQISFKKFLESAFKIGRS